ncbi:hypothetical protein HPB49_013087 [Dermacentor silvarum]|uniref:Uncharacterized protein n=1 Tax=Dermacentor silvarum TaxID=543639 RepID=A0ACB8CKX2_DERSI|nr:hypothetical protein HPB49_013087 [Dermacentor silvarum]
MKVLRDEFRQLPKSVHVAAGDSATLECVPPRGHPEPTVTWFKDGVQVQPGTGRVRLLAQGALLIADVRPSDQGRYVCRAANLLGTRDSPPALLSVHTKPYFVRVPEDVTALAEESVEFECKVNGDPKPTVTWRRKDGKMPVGRAYVQEDKNLHIRNVVPADEGSYVCEIENIVGSTSASAILIVHSRPTFRLTPQNQKVGINGVAKFDCLATGNPPPSVFWTREGSQELMFPGKSHGRFSVSQEGTLTITGVRKEDRGYYVCSALSVVGSSMAKGLLEVNVLTDLPPPIIRLGPANQTLPVHTTAQLPCEVAGTPKPTVKWLYSAVPLSIKDRPRFKLLGSGMLQIRGLAPQFVPDYNLDEVREKLSANVVTLHDIRTISSTAVKLTWKVYVDGNSSDLHLNKSTNSTAKSLTLNNLKTGILYEARVVAVTTVGGGPASSPIHFKIGHIYHDADAESDIEDMSRRPSLESSLAADTDYAPSHESHSQNQALSFSLPSQKIPRERGIRQAENNSSMHKNDVYGDNDATFGSKSGGKRKL